MDTEEHRRAMRAAQERAIKAAQQLFEETGIPLFAWNSYARCRHSGLPLPEWILQYFDDTARRLDALAGKAQSRNLFHDHRAETIAAFGMNVYGRGGVFARFVDQWVGDWEWLSIGEQVAAHVRKGMLLKVAIPAVAHERATEYRIPVETSQDEPPVTGGRWVLSIKDPSPPSENEVREAWQRYKAIYPDQCKKAPRKKMG